LLLPYRLLMVIKSSSLGLFPITRFPDHRITRDEIDRAAK